MRTRSPTRPKIKSAKTVAQGPANAYRIQVVDRLASILDCFTFDSPELSVSQLSAATGLHKSTAHRILMALELNGLVEQNEQTGGYHLGIKLFRLGHLAVARLNLRDIARPYLRELMEKTGETVHLAVLDSDQVLYLEKVEGPHALRMPSRVGRRIPTYCTSLGKAMLSCLDEAEIRRILKAHPMKQYTPNTAANIESLLKELKQTRRQGYIVDNEEIEIGLRCVGSPIRDYTGALAGAISIAAPSARLGLEKVSKIGGIVLDVAASISKQLGYSGEPRRGEESLPHGATSKVSAGDALARKSIRPGRT